MKQHRAFYRFYRAIGLLLFIGLFPALTSAQVSISPQNPDVDNDLVTITFNANEGNAALANYTQPIYIHTGVVTEKSGHPMEWLHVQGEWGKVNPKWEMTPKGNGLYEFTLKIRDFYQVPKPDQILKLMMVFRNADGTLVAKTAENTDLVVTISNYEPPYIVMPPDVEAKYMGNYLSHTLKNNLLTITTTNRSLQILPFTDKVVKFLFSDEKGNFDNKPSQTVMMQPGKVNATLQETPQKLLFKVGSLLITLNKNPMSIAVEQNGKTLLGAVNNGIFWKNDAKGIQLGINPNSAYYGGGSRAIELNRYGKYLKLYNNAWYGYTRGADHLNVTVPFLLSSNLWGLYFDNTDKAYFDIGKTLPDVLEYGTKNGNLCFYFMTGVNYPDLLMQYAHLTGTQPLPPRWALGYIQSKFGYRTEEETRQMVAKMKAAGFPIDAVVLDLYWFGDAINMGDIDWNRTQFPEPEKMMHDFTQQGISTILITEPYFTTQSKNFTDANEKQLFATDTAGNTFVIKDFWAGSAGLLDIFKPKAQDWFWDLYHARIKEGVAGWWCDLGEPERHPAEIQHINGSAERVHNLYSLEWAEMLHQNYRKFYPQTRLFTLIRSGFAGMQRYGAVTWSGDIQRSFKGLSIQPSIMLGMGLNGFGYMHSDLGGFTDGPQDEELYVRWLQFGMFNPIVRPHGFQVPPEPIHYSQQAQNIVRRYAQLRYALLPYNYTLAWENSTTGTPLARPLFFYEPQNSQLLNTDDVYYWGKNLLIAPILQSAQTERTFYLPQGYWFNFFTDQLYQGGKNITLPVTLENIPVLVRAGSFIPTAPAMPHTKHYQTDTLLLHYYPHTSVPQNYDVMYWDDGSTPNPISINKYELLHFKGALSAKKTTITLTKTGGWYNNMPTQRLMEVVIHNVAKKPKQCNLKQKKGKKLQEAPSPETMQKANHAWHYNAQTKQLHLKFTWQSTSTAKVEVK